MASNWVPMESDPESMNKFLQKAGLSKEWCMKDVHGLDLNDVTSCVPDQTKVLAFVFLFPKTIQAADKGSPEPKDVFFIKEVFPNASGPIALIHVLANNAECVGLKSDTPLGKFLAENKDKTPEERGKALEKDEKLMEIQVSAERKPMAFGEAEFHYVAIIRHADTLYELDGTKLGPKSHGKTTKETFVKDAAQACKKFIDENPGEHGFSVLAFAAAE